MLDEMSSWKKVLPIEKVSMKYDSYLTTRSIHIGISRIPHNRQKWHAWIEQYYLPLEYWLSYEVNGMSYDS